MIEREITDQGLPAVTLSDQQLALYEQLLKKDRSLAELYFGAIKVLRDSTNPARVRQAAYSMRELMENLAIHYGIQKDPIQTVFNKLSGLKATFDKVIRESDSYVEGVWEGTIDLSLSRFLDEAKEFFHWFSGRVTGKKAHTKLIQELRHYGILFATICAC